MEITETRNEGLERELKVVIPASRLEEEAMQKLNEMKAKAQIRGFRPGKVPITHLKKLYGKSVMAEVVQQMVDNSSREALSNKNMKPAYQPEIDLPEDEKEIDQIMDGKADLAYTMSFEVIPPIELQSFGDLKLEQFNAEVAESQIDDMLGNIAEQHKDFEPRADGAKAEMGDQVTISFVGTIDGEEFEGGAAEDVPLELGSGSFIPGFEEQLVGVKTGDDKVVKVTFPEDYTVETLAGKLAEFSVTVKAVEASRPSEINDALAARLGLDDLEALRQNVGERISLDNRQMTLMKLKRDVLDQLDKSYTFDLPQKLVDAEFDQIWQALTQEMEREKRSFEDEGSSEDDAKAEYKTIAERRVRLGLVLGLVGEQAEVTVTEEELQQALVERARQFPGQEKQVIEFYRNNPNGMAELRGPIFEQKVIDHIVESADVTEKTIPRDELIKLMEEDDHDHDHDHGDDKKADSAKKKPAKKKAAKKPAKKAAA